MARRRGLLRGGLAMLPLPALAQEAAYPTRPLRIIVPYPAGGVIDLVARITAEALSAHWRQTVLVEVRTGANGDIAAGVARDAPPDGHTILLGAPYVIANPHLQPGRGGDAFAAWQFAARLVEAPNLLVVPTASPATGLEALERLIRARPRGLSYGHGGLGTTPHLVTEIWLRLAGLEMEAVSYRGSPPIVPDLLQGSLTTAVLPLSVATPYLQAGTLRPLAIAAERRSAIFPQVPTLTELGHAPANLTTWCGLLLRAGTPPAIVRELGRATLAVLADPALGPRLAPLGAVAAPLGPAEFEAFARAEDARLREAINRYGVRAD